MAKKAYKTRLNSLNDLRRFLARKVNDADLGLIEPDKLRVLSYSCSILSSILKDSDIEQRLEKLEKQITDE